MIALYGLEVDELKRRNPRLYRALWLFRYRAMDRKAFETKRGIESVFSQRMDGSWFSHITETKDQADYAQDMAGGS